MMRGLLLLILFFTGLELSAQSDSLHIIKVHFVYGSKPKRKFKNTERKYFGGLHGGHVSIEVDSMEYGFGPNNGVHIFAHKKKHACDFAANRIQSTGKYPPKEHKAVTFFIPITAEQYSKINSIHQQYNEKMPYDYAFFGMRCASATQDILGQIGIVKPRKRFYNIVSTFYPKMLRKRIYKLAQEKNYRYVFQEGKPSRKWEKD